jgi:hypothetical protein
MRGRVLSPPVVDESRLLVVTDLGEMRIFEAPSEQPNLREIARQAGGDAYHGLTFSLLDRSALWVGRQELTSYQLQAAAGKLVSKWVRDTDDVFLGPMQRVGDALFHVRRRAGMRGATVAAMDVAASGDVEPVWETDVGVPSFLFNDGAVVTAVTANGAMFPIDREAAANGVTRRRTARIDPRLLPKALTQVEQVGANQYILAAPPPLRQMIYVDVKAQEIKLAPLRLGRDEATAELVPFGDGVLAACEAGPIQWVSATSGKPVREPFLPRIEPGAQVRWLRPTPLEGTTEFVAAEQSGRLYRVSAAGDDQMLTLAADNRLDGELSGGLASVGGKVYGVLRSPDGAESVAPITPDTLLLEAPTLLRSGWGWGPRRVGDVVLTLDAAGGVYCFDGGVAPRWTLTEPVGPLAGMPLALGGGRDGFVFTSERGQVWMVGAAGEIVARQDLSEPLGGGAVALGERLLLSGWDGTLYLINRPQ